MKKSTPTALAPINSGVPLVEIEINGKRALLHFGLGAWSRAGVNPFSADLSEWLLAITPEKALKFILAGLRNAEEFEPDEIADNLDPFAAVQAVQRVVEQMEKSGKDKGLIEPRSDTGPNPQVA